MYEAPLRNAVARIAVEVRRHFPNHRDEVDGLERAFNLKVIHREMAQSVWGLSDRTGRVTINQGLDLARWRFALAHETGHVLFGRGLVRIDSRDVERFSDWLAHEVLLPFEDIAEGRRTEAEILAAHRGVPEITIGAQMLRRVGSEQAAVCSDGMVLCRVCGHRPLVPGCLCFQLRSDGRRRQALPLVSELLSRDSWQAA